MHRLAQRPALGLRREGGPDQHGRIEAVLLLPHYNKRTGDLMREVVNADQKMIEFDPMRIAQPATEAEKRYPTRVRAGPDWLAFVSNWMTEWERTGDSKWGTRSWPASSPCWPCPIRLKSGRNLVYGYDPATGKLYPLSNEVGSYNLATIQGGAQVVFELNEFLNHPGWQKMWLQYCRLGSAPAEVLRRDQETGGGRRRPVRRRTGRRQPGHAAARRVRVLENP